MHVIGSVHCCWLACTLSSAYMVKIRILKIVNNFHAQSFALTKVFESLCFCKNSRCFCKKKKC